MDRRSAFAHGLDDDLLWALLDAAPDTMLVVDDEGRIVFAHDHGAGLFGYPAAELLELTIEDLLPADLRSVHRTHRRRYRADPTVRPMGSGLQLRARRADGSELPVEVSLSPLQVGDDGYTVAAVRDISERVRAEDHLRRSQDALRDAQQVVAVAEDRERIARDLHDTVIQRLFGAGLNLQATAGTADERTRARLETTITDLDETIKELRSAIFSLQGPSAAAPGGLRGRLLEVVNEYRAGLGFDPQLRFDGPVETIDDAIAAQLVPTVREALANVVRHAGARQVRVTIAVGAAVTLTVVDDGAGIGGRGRTGRGLTNMADRAAELGGTFAITPEPTGGTRLEWQVPSAGAPRGTADAPTGAADELPRGSG